MDKPADEIQPTEAEETAESILDSMDNLPSARQAREAVQRAAQQAADLAKLQKMVEMDPLERDRAEKEMAQDHNCRVSIIRQMLALVMEGGNPFQRSNGSSENSTPPAALDPLNDRRIALEIITDSNGPLELVRRAARRLYAGDLRPVELIYVAATSRLLSRPLNIQLIAQSGAGKNYTAETALAFIPPEAVYSLTASSPRALVYCDESFAHRIVFMGECDSIPRDGPAASAIRSIVNDASMTYSTVEKDPVSGKQVVRNIVKQGPTGLITTGVRTMDAQMSTRLITLGIKDDAEQTAAVIRAQGRIAMGATAPAIPKEEQEKFWAYQRSLAAVTKGVVVPFAETLAEMVPTKAVRMRRDYRQLLGTIMTMAVLHQERREKSPEGLVIATLADYAEARRLLAPLFDEIAIEGLTAAIRATVMKVPESGEANLTFLAEELNLDKSTVSWRVRRAIRAGWLRNLEQRSGYPARLQRGEPLPDEVSALPKPETLRKALESAALQDSAVGHSNGAQSTGRVERSDEPLDCAGHPNGYSDSVLTQDGENQDPGFDTEVF
jgi:hypothetical protein